MGEHSALPLPECKPLAMKCFPDACAARKCPSQSGVNRSTQWFSATIERVSSADRLAYGVLKPRLGFFPVTGRTLAAS